MKTLVLALCLSTSSAMLAAAEDPGARPLAGAVQLLGWPHERAIRGRVLDSRTEEVSALLRCPVCQGLSVADSPSSMARNMKGQVRDLVALGYDQEQVLSYFERSYGEFVRLKPPLRGVNWLVWLAPLLGLVAGGVVVARALRAPGAPAAFPSPQKRSV